MLGDLGIGPSNDRLVVGAFAALMLIAAVVVARGALAWFQGQDQNSWPLFRRVRR
jgi:hypothetical protein